MRQNTALLVDRSNFNQFTLALFAECTDYGKNPTKLVRVVLRNGIVEHVKWLGLELDTPKDAIFGDSVHARLWRADGSNFSNPDFDIIEF